MHCIDTEQSTCVAFYHMQSRFLLQTPEAASLHLKNYSEMYQLLCVRFVLHRTQQTVLADL